MKRSLPKWFNSPRIGYLLLVATAFAAGHLSFFQLRSATARLSEAFRPLAPEVPPTDWLPANSEPSPLPAGTALVRDDGGEIKAVFICFDSAWATNVSLLFTELFKKLPADVQIQVGCTDTASIEHFEREWGLAERSRGREVILLNASRPLTMWARDRQLALQGPQGKTRVSLLPRPLDVDKVKFRERAIPKLRLARGLVDRVGQIPFRLEGGNVVANGRHVFIGNNVLEQNEEELPDDTALCQELQSLFGRELLLVRDYAGKVPHEHLDMYFTALDSHNVLLADLAEGSALLEGQDGRKPLASVNVNPAKQRQLQEIAELLRKQGYTVHRIPAVFHAQGEWMVTYNNSLMERRNGEKIVYMPLYHLPLLDKAASAVYQRLGFRVEPIDVSELFRGCGTIRCVVNVTLRKPLTSSAP
jgi:hypothetical protein